MTLEVRFAPESVDVDGIVASFARLKDDAKVAFWCVFAHDLTVDVRGILDDEVSQDGHDRLKSINELLHQLTSCINPMKRRSAEPYDDVELLRLILTDDQRVGLRRMYLRAAARAVAAVRRDMPGARRPTTVVSR